MDGDIKRATVLIVEDEESLLRSLADELKFNDFDVVEARDGEQGLDIALKNAKVQIVILDLMLPKLNGVEILEKIREDKNKSDLPVIILTNMDADNSIINKLPALNPCFYLMKHEVTPMMLVSKIKECLSSYNNN